MHLSMHLSIKFPRRFILDPGTTCLRHLLPGSGLSGHTSPCDEYAYFDPYALFTLLTFLFRNTSRHTSPGKKSFSFSQEHHTFFGQPTSPATTVFGYITSWSDACDNCSDGVLTGWRCQEVKPHYSEKVKTVCCITMYSARGLGVGVLTPIPLWLDLG
jgi:hypothetical protein